MNWYSGTDGITIFITWEETQDIDELTKTINRMIDFEKRMDIMPKSNIYAINKKEEEYIRNDEIIVAELNKQYGLRKDIK